MNTFVIGEIAIFFYPSNPYHNEEMTVTGPLVYGPVVYFNGAIRSCWYHAIQDGMGLPWAGPVENLRKRRPPQDWVRLCKLEERPVEEVA